MTVETYDIDAKGRAVIPKSPGATLDYPFEWSEWLATVSDTISEAEIIVDQASGVSVASVSHTFTKVTAWIKGGIDGKTALVTCKITTVGGRVEEKSIYIKIKAGLS